MEYTNKVDVYIASMWRSGHLATTIKSLLLNSEVSTISAVCNNYTDEQIETIREGVDNSKVTLIKGANEKGCSEKLHYISSGYSRFVALCDDDLIYPTDYLSKLIEAAEKYKCLISCHGRILKKTKAVNYYRHKTAMYHCLHEVKQDVEVDICGSGVCLFERNSIRRITHLYNLVIFPNMTDIYLSFFAKIDGKKRIVIKHPKGWIKCKVSEETDNNIFDQHINNCKHQTDFINELFLGYGK